MSFELTGKLIDAGTTQQVTDSFQKREFVIEVIETVKGTEKMKCVEIFFNCVDHLPDKPRNLAKSKCQAYRASLPISYPHVGIAAKNRVFPFDHLALDDLRVFLHNLASYTA